MTNETAPELEQPIVFADDAPDLLSPELAAQLNPEDTGVDPELEAKIAQLMTGLRKGPKVRPIKFWYNGALITKEEHDKLSWQEIHDSNNVIRRARK